MAAVVAVFAATTTCGCGSTVTGGDVAEPTPRVLSRVTARGEPAARIEGTVALQDDGCVLLDGRLVVWPAGTDAVDGNIQLADGTAISDGMTVAGTGGYLPASDLRTLQELVREDLAPFDDCIDEQSDVAVFAAEGSLEIVE